MRHLTFIITSTFLATLAILVVSTTNPPTADAAKSVKRCGGGKISLKADERRAFLLHNKIRRDRDLRAFCVHPKLQRAARAHSKDMIRRDYFSHNTKGGGSFSKRLKRFGYTPKGFKYYTVGENIAYGSGPRGEPKRIMRSWMKSRGHKKNIVNRKFREIGIGTYTGTYKKLKGVTMYTADFGTRR